MLCEGFYPGYKVEVSDMFPISWLIIHYLLYYAVLLMNHIYCKALVDIGEGSLQKVLKQVAEVDLMGDSEAWRKIAFRANRCFANKKYNNPIFYSGEQCKRFFVREIFKTHRV